MMLVVLGLVHGSGSIATCLQSRCKVFDPTDVPEVPVIAGL